jgi:hypothetical protein
MGLLPEGGGAAAPDDLVWLWPENESVWRHWHRLQTQWRVGLGGREGLDYPGVATYLREVWRVKQRDFAPTFRCIQAMERAALEVWDSKRKK